MLDVGEVVEVLSEVLKEELFQAWDLWVSTPVAMATEHFHDVVVLGYVR